MTEWEKMQAHEIYDDFDADLFDRRVEAKNFSRNLMPLPMTKWRKDKKS